MLHTSIDAPYKKSQRRILPADGSRGGLGLPMNIKLAWTCLQIIRLQNVERLLVKAPLPQLIMTTLPSSLEKFETVATYKNVHVPPLLEQPIDHARKLKVAVSEYTALDCVPATD